MYTLAMAKNDAKEGWITEFTLVKKSDCWMIEVSQDDRLGGLTRCISTSRGELRLFRTVDAAIKTAEQIGFSVHALRLENI
jgi:hypothetical protein